MQCVRPTDKITHSVIAALITLMSGIVTLGIAGAAAAEEPVTPAAIIERAITVARTIENPVTRDLTLGYIAAAQAYAAAARYEEGDLPGGAAMLRGARSLADESRYEDLPADALAEVARAQAAAGDLPAAHSTIREALAANGSTATTLDNNEAIGKIIEACIGMGDLEGALAAARKADGLSEQADALLTIAAAQIDSGDRSGVAATLHEAEETASADEHAVSRTGTLTRIAELQARAGDSSGARQTLAKVLAGADLIKDAERQAVALAAISIAQAANGDVAGATENHARALSLVGSLADSRAKIDALSQIAVAQTEASNNPAATALLEQAMAVVQQIADSNHRDSALEDIAAAQAGSHLSRANEFVTSLGQALLLVGSARSKTIADPASGSLPPAVGTAVATTRMIENEEKRLRALARIADPSLAAGDRKTLLALAQEALAIVQASAKEERYLLDPRGIIAWVQAVADDLDAAGATARLMDDEAQRALILAGIAWAQSRVGDDAGARANLSEALPVLLGIRRWSQREGGMMFSVIAQWNLGDVEAALATADRIEDPEDRAKVLAQMAVGRPLFDRLR